MSIRFQGKRGMTLTELLVAISIIAVLAGMLLPGLSKAKSMARKTSCLNNGKQLSFALHLYAEDFAGVLPYSPAPSPGDSEFLRSFSYTVGGVCSQIQPYTGKKSMAWCPSDKVHSPTLNTNGWTAWMYRWAAAFHGSTRGAVQVTKFRFPDRQVIYHEILANHYDRAECWQLRSKTPHQPRLQAVLMDGHIQDWVVPLNPPDRQYAYDANWFFHGTDPAGLNHDMTEAYDQLGK